MNEPRILKALLFITQESGGLGPAQLDVWLGQLKKAGYIKPDLRKVDGCELPYWTITDEGKAKL
jgi:DNA-binding PadR family transcriptional regulator